MLLAALVSSIDAGGVRSQAKELHSLSGRSNGCERVCELLERLWSAQHLSVHIRKSIRERDERTCMVWRFASFFVDDGVCAFNSSLISWCYPDLADEASDVRRIRRVNCQGQMPFKLLVQCPVSGKPLRLQFCDQRVTGAVAHGTTITCQRFAFVIVPYAEDKERRFVPVRHLQREDARDVNLGPVIVLHDDLLLLIVKRRRKVQEHICCNL